MRKFFLTSKNTGNEMQLPISSLLRLVRLPSKIDWAYPRKPNAGEISMATYNLDPHHSSASFSVKHMMIATVRGSFSGLSGSLELDPNDYSTASVTANIDTTTITTGAADRDTHLKSADFFDVATYPQITFKSTGVQKLDDDEAKLTGDLTIKDTTRPVELTVEGSPVEAKDPWGNLRVGFSATGKIKRSAFGLNWNAALEAGGVLVGDDISITLDVQFVKA
jgi:polyisoprenoid-binding protein YceI